MPGISINSIILGGLIMAFVLPALAIVSLTLPNPPMYSASVNMSTELNSVGLNITNNFGGISNQLFNQTVTGGTANSLNGSFFSNPAVTSAFAFMLNGFGFIVTDLIKLPILDYTSLVFIESGMATLLPSVAVTVLSLGIDLLYTYMIITIIIQGCSMVLKYNIQSAQG